MLKEQLMGHSLIGTDLFFLPKNNGAYHLKRTETAENKRQIQSSVDAQNLQPKHIPFSSQIDAYPGVSVFHLLIIFSNRTRMFPTPPCHVEILLFSTVTIPISYPTVHIVVQLVPHVLYSNIPIQSHVLFTFLLRSLRV